MGPHGGAKCLWSQQCHCLQEHFRPDSDTSNPHGEITGHLILCTNSSWFFACKETGHSSASVCILITPQRTKGQPKYTLCVVLTGTSWRHCSEESLAHPEHKHSFFWDWPPAEPDCSPLSKPVSPLSFLPPLLPGSEQKQEQGENALGSKIKKYWGQKSDSLTSDKGKPRNLAEISMPSLQEGRKNRLEQACHHPWSWCQKALLCLADYGTIKTWRGGSLSICFMDCCLTQRELRFLFRIPAPALETPWATARMWFTSTQGSEVPNSCHLTGPGWGVAACYEFSTFLKIKW